jgi:hypothetical protein
MLNRIAHGSNDIGTYNAIWNELISDQIDQGANKSSNGIVAIFRGIKRLNPLVKPCILWTDSYVAPNRNSFMS